VNKIYISHWQTIVTIITQKNMQTIVLQYNG